MMTPQDEILVAQLKTILNKYPNVRYTPNLTKDKQALAKALKTCIQTFNEANPALLAYVRFSSVWYTPTILGVVNRANPSLTSFKLVPDFRRPTLKPSLITVDTLAPDNPKYLQAF